MVRAAIGFQNFLCLQIFSNLQLIFKFSTICGMHYEPLLAERVPTAVRKPAEGGGSIFATSFPRFSFMNEYLLYFE
ncbi:hypothetical protein LA303_07965 [Candidatus Sulfidibacterium hydrothermale]|uniref:hypothetical protein n=1 Tax=Candidatus Sulfidibacterium hydrothermale TaxID=2875962 RepID=UPI001F0B5345|nr:hypothetical protein [Candidatus Sulfidibacterium hydrothermale]UBM61313.1 hypothetical protein LA303_07735 [Candidatus Sulfidibacterium hydrothermale]UBM61359.1 hypothetical protein LA303_07965 [Candidatus Sulfidibacterium hydrothermale]